MVYYVVIDTNVVISAVIKASSNPGMIMRLVDAGIIAPLINEDILKEYRTVLNRPKFHFNPEDIEKYLNLFEAHSVNVEEEHVDIKLPDEKDRVFYEVVLASKKQRASWLTTGNIKHFPTETFIVTPKELCDIILGGGEQNKKS